MRAGPVGHPAPMSRRLPGWPGIVDTHIAVGGRRVRALIAEPKGSQDGEPHLLVHGLGGSSVTWVEVMEGLSTEGPVVAVDLPGFGRTAAGPDDALTVSGFVEFLTEVADALGWDRFGLHGNSMGGLISVLFAARHPDRVARLVLVSPALPPRSPVQMLVPSRATIEGLAPLAYSSATAAALAAAGLTGPKLSARRNRELLKLIFPDPNAVDRRILGLMAADFAYNGISAGDRRQALLSALRSITTMWAAPWGTWRAIGKVQAPTLVLGGTRDALVPARVLRAVLAKRSDWHGHVLDDRRHALMLEDPGMYLDLVSQWRRGTGRAA